MVKKAVKGLKRVEVDHFDGLLVDYLKRKNSRTIIRGLRAISDFEYEFQMALMNRRLNRDAETVFMMPAEPYTYLSSNIVREIVRRGGKVAGLVPPHVAVALKSRLGRRRV
jgi:pantetheine-phosphate adenylyltransferase